MNKKRGFTLVELIITMAVSIIVLTMIASLSYITNKIVSTQKYESELESEIAITKVQIENYFKSYASSNFKLEKSQVVDGETVTDIITIFNSSDQYITSLEICDNEVKTFILNEIDEKQQKNILNFSYIKTINFDASDEFGVLKCEIVLSDSQSRVFLINMGGASFDF